MLIYVLEMRNIAALLAYIAKHGIPMSKWAFLYQALLSYVNKITL